MKTGISVLIFLSAVFTAFNIHNIYAYWWKAENAVVALADCSGENCTLTGTLRIEPWTGNRQLTKADGSVLTLSEGSFSLISYPAAHQ